MKSQGNITSRRSIAAATGLALAWLVAPMPAVAQNAYITNQVAVGSNPVGVAVKPDGRKVYVANRGNRTYRSSLQRVIPWLRRSRCWHFSDSVRHFHFGRDLPEHQGRQTCHGTRVSRQCPAANAAYSITSSAVASSCGGTVRPRVFAASA